MEPTSNDLKSAKALLVPIVRRIARNKDVKARLAKGKAGRKDLDRPDFVWHELLLSFATMGNSRGAEGLIRNQDNYQRVTFEALTRKPTKAARLKELLTVLRAAKVRMPPKKAVWLAEAFERVKEMGGPRKAKAELFRRGGCEGKIRFWQEFDGIGQYSRNIMMDVYHPDFKDYIAVDERIRKITRALRLAFRADRVLEELEDAEDLPAVRAALREKTIPWEHMKRDLNL